MHSLQPAGFEFTNGPDCCKNAEMKVKDVLALWSCQGPLLCRFTCAPMCHSQGRIRILVMNLVAPDPAMSTLHVGAVKKCILVGREEGAKAS